jgi:hypothetical protein
MTLYLKHLEYNLNNKFAKELDEYQKYLKMFYSDTSRCPIDAKTPLEKSENNKEYNMFCKTKSGKEWSIKIKKPIIYNLNLRYSEINNLFKNQGLLFKEQLRKNMESPVYNAEKDKDIEKMLKELKTYEEEMESIKSIFNRQQELEKEIINARQEILKNMLEIKIKKDNLFKICPKIDSDSRKKLIEIAKNEKNPTQQRISQIAKEINLKNDEVTNWLKYFGLIFEYTEENGKLNVENEKMIKLKSSFENLYLHFVVEPPVFEMGKGYKTLEISEEEKPEKIRIRMRKT